MEQIPPPKSRRNETDIDIATDLIFALSYGHKSIAPMAEQTAETGRLEPTTATMNDRMAFESVQVDRLLNLTHT